MPECIFNDDVKVHAADACVLMVNTTWQNTTGSEPQLKILHACFVNQTPIYTGPLDAVQVDYDIQVAHTGNALRINIYYDYNVKVYGDLFCVIKLVDLHNKLLAKIRGNTVRCCSIFCDDKCYRDYLRMISARSWDIIDDMVAQYVHHFNASKINPGIEMIKDLRADMELIFVQSTILILVIALVVCMCVVLCCVRIEQSRLEKNKRNRLRLLESLKLMEDSGELVKEMKYDIFLSHSSKDRTFIERVLLPKLESFGYRCCYDPRDFAIGQPIIHSIAHAIYSSHKTLTLFSKNYMKSRWCVDHEFMMVYFRIINDYGPTDSLIIMEYQPCNVPEVLTKQNFVDWHKYTNKDHFWLALCKLLGPPAHQ
jgi:hypothetical protein